MTGILSLTTFAPLVGALLILAFKQFAPASDVARNARWIALLTTLVTLALSILVVAGFDTSQPGMQFSENLPWFGGVSYRMGVDGISVLLVLLTAFLMPLSIVASWAPIKDRVAEYMIAFLVLETLMIGAFLAMDLIVFYIFFEGTLVPMFLIIGIWGGKNRVYAAYKFFLYTLAGSVLMLAAILTMAGIAGTTSIPELMAYHFAPGVQIWLWLAFFASFAVKMPMWPVHTWLPDAHVEAPTAGSVILAGVLLKLGGYGFLRFSLPMFPYASAYFTPLVFALSVIAIVYTSLVAFRQTDMKKLIAYSSVAHMGFVTMGIFSGNSPGHPGRPVPDAEPWGDLGRAVPLRRRGLRPHAHPRDRLLRRAGEPDAVVRGDVHAVHDGQCRPARDERFRRRVPDHDRRVRRVHHHRPVRRHWRHPVGGLRPDALPARGVRGDGQSQARRHHRPGLAGGGDLRASDSGRLDPGCLSAPGDRRNGHLPSTG